MNGKKSGTHDITSPVINNWIFIQIKGMKYRLTTMTIYEYRKIRFDLKTLTPINKKGKILAMGMVKPIDPRHWILINDFDRRALLSFYDSCLGLNYDLSEYENIPEKYKERINEIKQSKTNSKVS